MRTKANKSGLNFQINLLNSVRSDLNKVVVYVI